MDRGGRIAIAIACAALAGCSFFGPRTQMILVTSDPPGASVFANGLPIGSTPMQHRVRRSQDLLIEVRAPGYQTEFRQPNRTLSALGILDAAGGAVIFIPFVGLLSSAAWKHEPSTFAVVLTQKPGPQRAETR
jgi:hypothetical protein